MSRRDLKQLILDASLAVFAKVGFDRATIGQILAQAGISNGGLFHHFASKDAIAEALYLRGIASYQDGLLKALELHRDPKASHDATATRETRAARETVKAAVRHHLAWVEANRDLAWFMYEHGRPDWQPAHGTEVRKLNRATAVHVRDWMAPLVQAGVIRDLPLTVLAALVNGPAHFVARRWLSGLTSARPTSFADMLAEAAWTAIAPYKPRASSVPPRCCSPATLIEDATLDALAPLSPGGAWSIVQLAMNSTLQAAPPAEAAVVRSIGRERDGRLAALEIDLVDPEGRAVARGSVVCLWREASAGRPSMGEQS